MKKLSLLIISFLVLLSCEKDSELIQETPAIDLVATVFNQTASIDLDQSKEGLYRGVFSTYDLSVKGEILIDLGNSKKYQAAVKLLRGGDSFYLEGKKENNRVDTYTFESEKGSFAISILPNNNDKIIINHFDFDDKDAYIVAYKERQGADISISYGNFTDDGDPLFIGNWDAINKGATYISPPAHSTIPTDLTIIEEIIISKDGDIAISTDTAPYNDSFFESCFYNDTFQHGYFFENEFGYKEIVAFNQTNTFLGNVCNWSLSYYLLDGVFTYDTPTCGTPAESGYGSWSWNGRNGKIFVERLGLL